MNYLRVRFSSGVKLRNSLALPDPSALVLLPNINVNDVTPFQG